jgi:hypothetical protein
MSLGFGFGLPRLAPIGGAVVAWTPAELGASLALWLDADDASTITLNGSNVSQWNDKSGNNRHATQATAVYQPAYDLTTFGGKPALLWPEEENPRGIAVAPAFAVASVFTVTRYSNGATSPFLRPFQGLFGANSTGQNGLIAASAGPNWGAPTFTTTVRYNGGAPGAFNAVPAVPRPNAIVEASYGTPVTFTGGMMFGHDRTFHSLNRGWSGPIAEVVLAAATLSTDDRQKLEGYLAWKWGGV